MMLNLMYPRGQDRKIVKLFADVTHTVSGQLVTNIAGETCGMEPEAAAYFVEQGLASYDLEAVGPTAEENPWKPGERAPKGPKVMVKLLRPYDSFNAGELAGYPEEQAAFMFKHRIAEPAIKPSPVANALSAMKAALGRR